MDLDKRIDELLTEMLRLRANELAEKGHDGAAAVLRLAMSLVRPAEVVCVDPIPLSDEEQAALSYLTARKRQAMAERKGGQQ